MGYGPLKQTVHSQCFGDNLFFLVPQGWNNTNNVDVTSNIQLKIEYVQIKRQKNITYLG